MARYAIVQDSDDLILNVVEWDGVADWTPPAGTHSELDSADEAVVGGTHNGTSFVAPTAPDALSVDTASQVIAADNSATGTVVITDSRGASANGKTVKIKIPTGGNAAIDGDSYVLAGVGQATVTFQATTGFTGDLEFEAYYANAEATPVKFTVRRGTA